jgi:hypothetical protein
VEAQAPRINTAELENFMIDDSAEDETRTRNRQFLL